MLIHVEQKHIDEGQEYNSHYCPIALAIKEQTGEIFDVDYVEIRNGTKQYQVTRSVSKFIKKFDNYGKNFVKPFNFKLIKLN